MSIVLAILFSLLIGVLLGRAIGTRRQPRGPRRTRVRRGGLVADHQRRALGIEARPPSDSPTLPMMPPLLEPPRGRGPQLDWDDTP